MLNESKRLSFTRTQGECGLKFHKVEYSKVVSKICPEQIYLKQVSANILKI